VYDRALVVVRYACVAFLGFGLGLGCGRIDFDGGNDGAVTPGCVKAITAYGDQVCALRTDGSVYCWGSGGNGQLGDGTLIERLVPAPATITDVDKLTSGEDTVCAIKLDGSLWCWGANDMGQVGDNTMIDRPLPTPVPLQAAVLDAASSQYHSCARLVNGTAFCWGSNAFGELGFDPPPSTSLTPIAVNQINGSRTMAIGDNVVCVVRPSQVVECWGRDSEGELGDGLNVMRSTAAPVLIPDPVAQVAGGCHRHWCAVTTLGDVWCWGENLNGQLGRGTTTMFESTPARVGGLPSAVQVQVGADHSCARTTAGEIWCWGNDLRGALGDGTFASSAVPVRASTLGTPVDVQTTCSGTLVLRDDARLVAWGAFTDLGTGEVVDRSTAAEVPIPCP